MAPAGKTSNAFAALREESIVLKQKEKKERALERKARKEADVATTIVHQTIPVSAVSLQHGSSWADMYDDDDEDEIAEVLPKVEGLDAYLSSSDDDGSDDEDDDEHVDGETLPGDSISEQNKVNNVDGRKNEETQPVKTLSKKEQKRKDLADLEALLSDLGLKVEVEESTTTTAQRAGTVEDNALGTTSKNKKKKKKQEERTAVPAVSGGEEEEVQSSVTVARDEALANLRKVAAKKKKVTTGASVPAAVLAEAKKKAEAKKSKQKKDKHMFDR